MEKKDIGKRSVAAAAIADADGEDDPPKAMRSGATAGKMHYVMKSIHRAGTERNPLLARLVQQQAKDRHWEATADQR
jgi:hypothetical protein